MDHDEIQRYLDVSSAHSVTVDVQEVSEAPGNLRTITIHRDIRVAIEFQKCSEYASADWEGGGLKYVGKYSALLDAVLSLEEFLGRAVREWVNFTREPYEPAVLEEPDPAANLAYFERLVRENNMVLPRGGGFQLAGIYWRHVQRYGTYRPDKLLEEQELTLKDRDTED
jgi:hypothetical protein